VQQSEAIIRHVVKGENITAIARSYNVCPRTIARLFKETRTSNEVFEDPAPQEPVTCNQPDNSGLMLQSSGLLDPSGVLAGRLARGFKH
jgi:hypothetical protein